MATAKLITPALEPAPLSLFARLLKFWKHPEPVITKTTACRHVGTTVYVNGMDEATCECGADLTE